MIVDWSIVKIALWWLSLDFVYKETVLVQNPDDGLVLPDNKSLPWPMLTIFDVTIWRQ